MKSFKKKSSKIPRGYRLKPATHKLINTLSRLLHVDQDEIISKACRKYYREVRELAVNGNIKI